MAPETYDPRRPLSPPAPDTPLPTAGDIPPALSPLDALALQGRLLQKRFEEQVESGRRMSRLSPVVVANEIAKARPTFFRSLSQNDVSSRKVELDPLPPMPTNRPEEVRPTYRPVSQYPLVQFGGVHSPDNESPPPIDSMPPPPRRTDSNMSSTLQPPLSPTSIPSPSRSPSAASEPRGSIGSPRPSYNFSRPLSRGQMHGDHNLAGGFRRQGSNLSISSRPSFDLPDRTDMGGSPSTLMTADGPRTPNEGVTNQEHEGVYANGEGSASYIYSKYHLPRGKALPRGPDGSNGSPEKPAAWNREGSMARSKEIEDIKSMLPLKKPGSPASPGLASRNRPANITVPAMQRSVSMGTPAQRKHQHKAKTSLPSPLESRSTPTTPQNRKQSSEVPPPSTTEDHFQRGIICHEENNLQESTYHFRLAAKGGHSRAMLFYALACRHGWGMKPNAQEGVVWLQKAVDSSQLEVADDEDLVHRGEQTDFQERKSHKAQFALSVYELGISYSKGWGVAQDKSLALRCFEIAGNWGDVDALAEAGFCYAEGVGCKKDLRRAAKLYRQAEAKGMSMTGNSWIYKDKYMVEPDDAPSERGRKSQDQEGAANAKMKRSKSRTRSFFGRKKSIGT